MLPKFRKDLVKAERAEETTPKKMSDLNAELKEDLDLLWKKSFGDEEKITERGMASFLMSQDYRDWSSQLGGNDTEIKRALQKRKERSNKKGWFEITWSEKMITQTPT